MIGELLMTAGLLLAGVTVCAFLWYAIVHSVVTRAPVAPHHRVVLERPGRYILWFEKPGFSAFSLKSAGQPFPVVGQVVSCHLREAASGQEIPVWGCVGMVGATGITRMRRPLWWVRIERPGAYDLYLPDLPMDDRRLGCNIVFARPLLGAGIAMAGSLAIAVPLFIAGIVLMEPTEPASPTPTWRPRPARLEACLEQDVRCPQVAARVEQGCAEGHGWSCEALGLLRQVGAGVELDLAGAADAWRRACDADQERACQELADAYLEGRGVAVDPQRAAEPLRRACELGALTSCETLGLMLLEGERVPRDAADARELLQRGCAGGLAGSCHTLGLALWRGEGGEPDLGGALGHLVTSCQAEVAAACSDGAELALEAGLDALDQRWFWSQACRLGLEEVCDRGPPAAGVGATALAPGARSR